MAVERAGLVAPPLSLPQPAIAAATSSGTPNGNVRLIGITVAAAELEAGGGCTRNMRSHLAPIAVALGVLAAPAVAPAKEISKVSVCGTGGQCTTYDESDFKSLMFLAQDTGPTDPPPAPAPWYRVRFTVDMREEGGGYDSWTVAYVPSADSLRVRDESGGFAWAALNPRTAAVFERAARDLPAFPKTRLRGLPVKTPQAPARTTAATRDGSDSGTTLWGWIVGGALAAALVLLVLIGRSRRRQRHVEVAPSRT